MFVQMDRPGRMLLPELDVCETFIGSINFAADENKYKTVSGDS